jgi:IS605 OrfB family transposase
VRSAKKNEEKDKWAGFIHSLDLAEETGSWFPYTVELKLRGGQLYAHVSVEEDFPPPTLTREDGVIAMDVNASPFHLALAEVAPSGNLIGYERISLHELLGAGKEERTNLCWQVAHQVVRLALEKGKAIAMEDLGKLPRGRRGDGLPKLRRRLQRWVYRAILEKVEILARRHGVEVVKADPAYTSVIGELKYAPQYLVDKDVAGALVVGRRALGFEEKLPKNYGLLLRDEEYLLYSLAMLEENVRRLRQELREEKNEWKRKAIKKRLQDARSEVKVLQKHLHVLQSGGSEPASRHPADRRKEPVRGSPSGWRKSWRVLSVALTVPLLGRFPQVKGTVRDFSPLRRVLTAGDWKRAVMRSVPVPGAGTAVQECLNTFVQF